MMMIADFKNKTNISGTKSSSAADFFLFIHYWYEHVFLPRYIHYSHIFHQNRDNKSIFQIK
jgi:hypothetical protein